MRVASLAVLVLLGSVAAAKAQEAPVDCSAILGPADCPAIVGAPLTPGAPAAAPATLAAPAAPPYTATFLTTFYGQGGQAALPSAYANGLIGVVPYDPATGVLDPAFVSALGLDPKVPLTIQQFQQYWSAPNSNGNYGTG